jgi:3-oxoacyl-[acyl-carrier protein] reductase
MLETAWRPAALSGLPGAPMQLGLEGNVVLVTGSSRGIGAAIALELAQEGCDLALAARSAEGLEATAAEVRARGRRALCFPADLRDDDAPARFVAAAHAEFGRIDSVVCNAGSTQRGDFLALSEEAWADGFALKFTAHRRLLRAAWPHLVNSRGSVVLIAGVGGRTPGAEFSIGGAVNAALLSLCKALAERGAADGVRVNAINPGGVRTERLVTRIRALAKRQEIPEAAAERELAKQLGSFRLGEPEDIAAWVALAVSPKGGYLHGALIDLDGGQTKTL